MVGKYYSCVNSRKRVQKCPSFHGACFFLREILSSVAAFELAARVVAEGKGEV